MKGSYILIIEVPERRKIEVGGLGSVEFPQGSYAYLGSAQGGFRARIGRHLSETKKLRWHIDYLLKQAEITEIILCPDSGTSAIRLECFLAQKLVREFSFIPRFGSSDCHCPSHLYFAPEKSELESRIIRAIAEAGLTYQVFSREAAEKYFKTRRDCPKNLSNIDFPSY